MFSWVKVFFGGGDLAAPRRGCLLPALPAWARREGSSRQLSWRQQSLLKIFAMKPQHGSIFVEVFYFVRDAQRYLVIFCWLLPNTQVENFIFCFTLAFPPVPFTRLYLSFDYSILNIPMTFLHTNASLVESDVF